MSDAARSLARSQASVQKENEKHELLQILNEQNEKRTQLKLEVRERDSARRPVLIAAYARGAPRTVPPYAPV